MISKIFFIVALLVSIIWIIVFSFFSDSLVIHAIAILAFVLLAISYVTRNNEN